eukprot:1494564-Karenia_brevis.AAC.1
MYSKLNSVYMRGLRRIAGKVKFDATSAREAGSDHSVRVMLGAPSLLCIIMRRRLLLLASVLRYGPPHLLAILATRSKTNECAPLPWVSLVLADLRQLWAAQRARFDELGSPEDSPD